MSDPSHISVAILAGGRARRIGTDKAFLVYDGRPFIKVISDEMLKVSGDVVMVIGHKDASLFANIVDKRVKLVEDDYNLQNPMGGMLSACPHLKNSYCAFAACDTPMLKSGIIEYLNMKAAGHSAAVPIWENKDTQPLCAVYNVQETYSAGRNALSKGMIGCNNLLSFMKDVKYVSVEELRRIDFNLLSFRNINTLQDMKHLK